jgi:hypothetical protein
VTTFDRSGAVVSARQRLAEAGKADRRDRISNALLERSPKPGAFILKLRPRHLKAIAAQELLMRAPSLVL